ncbi:hypothetical protein RQP46_001623 [Phenoliferia psychrophenolica]
MASTQLSLIGTLSAELHAQVVARLATAAEQGLAYSTTETFFERGTEPIAADENVLRLRETQLARNGSKVFRSVQVLQKPESARISPEILQRSLTEASIAEGDAFEFVSSLGYQRKRSSYQKGIRFIRGAVEVLIYQLFETSSSTTAIDPQSYTVTVTTRSANPRAPGGGGGGGAGGSASQQGPSAQDLKNEAIERLKETRAVLQGLVNLSRGGE